MTTLHGWMGGMSRSINIPAGIIIPFNDVAANIPAGWSQWTTGADRALLGHASIAGTNGGASAITRASTTDGGHTSVGYTGWGTTTGGSAADLFTAVPQGDHSHSVSINYTPAKRLQVLMKSLAEYGAFPAKSGILSDKSLSLIGLTDITPIGYLLGGAAGSSSSNNPSLSSFGSTDSLGNHSHISGAGALMAGGTAAATNYSGGYDSSHGGTASVTADAIYRYYLGMWSHASAQILAIPGMYGLWESATPPHGWAICDGTRGTPNLSGYHIGLDSGALVGTKTGNGTITTSGSLATAGSHNHNSASAVRNTAATAYHSDLVSHTHIVSSLAAAFAPLNRTIIFIKATG